MGKEIIQMRGKIYFKVIKDYRDFLYYGGNPPEVRMEISLIASPETYNKYISLGNATADGEVHPELVKKFGELINEMRKDMGLKEL